jgi:phytol kinase
MFVGGFCTSLLLAYYLAAFGYLQVDSASVIGLALVSAAATVIESLPINQVLDDNISVPLAVTYLGMYLL